jgi:hypothetical protein
MAFVSILFSYLCRLDPDALGRGICLVYDVAGIANAGWLKNDDLRFIVRGRSMLDAALHHDGLARSQIDNPVTEFNAEFSFLNQKELVLRFVRVPGKLTLNLHQFDVLSV